jgi:hypothetical protein
MRFATNLYSHHIYRHYRVLLDELERLWILKSRLTPGITALDTEWH